MDARGSAIYCTALTEVAMERRSFLHTSFALSLAGAAGATHAHAGVPPVSHRSADPIRLDSNENALGLAPVARQAIIDGISEANRYPRDKRRELTELLAAKHGVAPDSIVLGNGSTEVLQMMVQACAGRRTKLVLADPTFEHVSDYALPETYTRESVPLDQRLAHDIGRMRDLAARSWDPVLVYICNPNNPTGTLTPCSEIDAWIESAPENVRFMIDEAYFEYVSDPGYESSVKWISTRPNVLVVRTFSKIFAMAGMRLGYGIAHPDTANHVRQFMGSSNANELALRAAVASLGDNGLVARSVESNTRGKRILCDCLDSLGLEYFPSQGNFLMHRIPGELRAYISRMREHGILVGRPFPPMLTCSRVSIGLPNEMERLAETLRAFRANGWV